MKKEKQFNKNKKQNQNYKNQKYKLQYMEFVEDFMEYLNGITKKKEEKI